MSYTWQSSVVALALLIMLGTVVTLVGLWAWPYRARKLKAKYTGQLETVLASQQLLERKLAEAERKGREYFDRIDGIVNEANGYRSLYITSSATHAAAQDMMLRERELLVKQYLVLAAQYKQATGKKPPREQPMVNSVVEQVASEFRETHVTPYVAARPDGSTITSGMTVG